MRYSLIHKIDLYLSNKGGIGSVTIFRLFFLTSFHNFGQHVGCDDFLELLSIVLPDHVDWQFWVDRGKRCNFVFLFHCKIWRGCIVWLRRASLILIQANTLHYWLGQGESRSVLRHCFFWRGWALCATVSKIDIWSFYTSIVSFFFFFFVWCMHTHSTVWKKKFSRRLSSMC